MSVKYSPRIVSNGLILYLDVGNSKSYSGSGSVWYDLIQNIPFNSNGTQTPYTTKNGVRCFDFNGSGYWECSDADSKKVDMRGNFTLILWYYSETVSNRRTIFEKLGTSYVSYQQELAVTFEVGYNASWYRGYSPDYDYSNVASWNNESWNQISIKGTTNLPRNGYYSLNGSAWTQNYGQRSTDDITQASSIRVGTGYSGTQEVGYISNVMVYNTLLSDSDIYQNYNVLKSRFGL